MGVVISKPAVNIREQLTELKAQQGYEERQFHFDDLVTNGTFDTDTSGWISRNDAVLSVVSQRLRVTNNVTDYGHAYQAITTVVGETYYLTADMFAGSTSFARISIGNSAGSSNVTGVNFTAPDSAAFPFVANSTTTYINLQCNTTGDTDYVDFDNVSVYTSDGTDVAFTMPKGWKPLHVFEDGALQREGSAYDYTVEYDGFNYIVKETVAPVASSSTTVIGVRA